MAPPEGGERKGAHTQKNPDWLHLLWISPPSPINEGTFGSLSLSPVAPVFFLLPVFKGDRTRKTHSSRPPQHNRENWQGVWVCAPPLMAIKRNEACGHDPSPLFNNPYLLRARTQRKGGYLATFVNLATFFFPHQNVNSRSKESIKTQGRYT